MYEKVKFCSPFVDAYEKSLQQEVEPIKDDNPDPIIKMDTMPMTEPITIGPGDPMFEQLKNLNHISQLKGQLQPSAISDDMKKLMEPYLESLKKSKKKPIKTASEKLKAKRKTKLANMSKRRNRK